MIKAFATGILAGSFTMLLLIQNFEITFGILFGFVSWFTKNLYDTW